MRGTFIIFISDIQVVEKMAAFLSQSRAIWLMIAFSLCLMITSAEDYLNDINAVTSKRHLNPDLDSAPAEEVLQGHDNHQQAESNITKSKEEARGNFSLFDKLFPSGVKKPAGIRESLLEKYKGEADDIEHSAEEAYARTALKHLTTDDDDVVGPSSQGKLMIEDLVAKDDQRSKDEDKSLLALIQQFRTSEDSSDRLYGHSAMTVLLTSSTSKILQAKWIESRMTPDDALRLLIGPITDSKLQIFFRHDLAAPWLSYVGLCWKRQMDNLSGKQLFQYFQRANLTVEMMKTKLLEAANLRMASWC